MAGMEVLYNPIVIPKHLKPVALTIGNFDGVHKGHQAVLNRVKELAIQENEHSIVLTFLNHPSRVLRPEVNLAMLCTQKHKIKLLKEQNIDATLLIEFTHEFSQQTAEQFLENLYSHFPFKHLVLGHDAVIGKDRQGDPNHIKDLAKQLNFQLEYIPPYISDKTIISSSIVREKIRKGELADAEKLLGRKYSIYSSVISGEGKGRTLGFPTANIEVE